MITDQDFGWIERTSLDALTAQAAAKRDAGHGRLVSYSRKVFIPLTKLCRDVCHYCTFAEKHAILYLQRPTIEETLEVIQRFGEEVVRKS